MNFRNIHIGHIVKTRVAEYGIEMSRICNFLKCTEKEIEEMYKQENLSTDILLKWSKLLKYDFFRIYTQHMILYSPSCTIGEKPDKKQSLLPQFRKSIYMREMIDFILELIDTKEKTKQEIIEEYRIPKTTLHKWIEKYSKDENK